MKQTLLGKTLEELQQVALSVGLQKFAGKQLAEWLYARRATSFEQMTNISLKGRQALEQQYTIGRHKPVAEAVSKDGTKKYLFRLSGDEWKGDVYIESVYIPDNDRATLCVSTQAGCKMGCKFCMTGTLGFHGQLPVGEILNQIFSIPDSDKLTNIVYMGEGEPMDNIHHVLRSLQVMTESWGCAWSPKRITVSTVGVVPGLERFLKESECHLAVSLHNPFAPERMSVMPVQGAWPVQEVIDLIKQYDFTGQRRVSFEYTMFAGFNDSKTHADALFRMLRGLECRMNLIRFHKIPDFPYTTSPDLIIENFKNRLNNLGVMTTVRASRGEDILAACGMLAGEHQK